MTVHNNLDKDVDNKRDVHKENRKENGEDRGVEGSQGKQADNKLLVIPSGQGTGPEGVGEVESQLVQGESKVMEQGDPGGQMEADTLLLMMHAIYDKRGWKSRMRVGQYSRTWLDKGMFPWIVQIA